MKPPLHFVFLSALVFGCSGALAQRPVRSYPPAPPLAETSLAGLQVSLTTSGYKFPLGEATGAARPVREWFVASVLVANRSSSDLTFTFPTAAAAQNKWTFRIFNSAGVQLWQSDADVMSAQVLTDATLEKRGRWKRLIQVPLRIDDKLLPPGIYTLEASLDTNRSLGASVLFEVSAPLQNR